MDAMHEQTGQDGNQLWTEEGANATGGRQRGYIFPMAGKELQRL
jgi:hypothetical protein